MLSLTVNVGILFSFHEIDYNSHVCKIYFKAHIKRQQRGQS